MDKGAYMCRHEDNKLPRPKGQTQRILKSVPPSDASHELSNRSKKQENQPNPTPTPFPS